MATPKLHDASDSSHHSGSNQPKFINHIDRQVSAISRNTSGIMGCNLIKPTETAPQLLKNKIDLV